MIQFKVGLYNLNDDANYNYQLNRLINWDGGDLDETAAVSHDIRTHDDWKHTLIRLGDNALKEGRTENAIAYYRMSEFFMSDGDGDKLAYYKKAVDLFYTLIKPENRMLNDGEKAGFSGKKREISGI